VLIILTNSEDATSDYLCEVLRANCINYRRLDTDNIQKECSIGYKVGVSHLKIKSEQISSADIETVLVRRPKRLKIAGDPSAETDHATDEWIEALEGFLAHVSFSKWVNHPSANAGASHKIEQISRARKLGLSAPDTLLTQEANEAKRFFAKHEHQVVVKPLASGYIERDKQLNDTVIYTSLISTKHLDQLGLICKCPTLFQQAVNKISDVRVCYVDGQTTAVELAFSENGRQRLDIRRNHMRGVKYRVVEIPSKVKKALHRLMQSYKLRFGAIDFVLDRRGEWYFLEINPNGQWAWLDLEGNSNVAGSFVRALG
jgi:glutathione synthase/RimK-type ligase-like ATP-grasp enzyme